MCNLTTTCGMETAIAITHPLEIVGISGKLHAYGVNDIKVNTSNDFFFSPLKRKVIGEHRTLLSQRVAEPE